jgi:hypothetical protein
MRPVPCRDYNVTSAAEHCRDPYSLPIEKVPTPLAMTAPLADLTAELTGEPARLIPLTLALNWVADHRELGEQKWPSERLLKGLLGKCAPAAATGGKKNTHLPTV